jgi:hypothetical protein
VKKLTLYRLYQKPDVGTPGILCGQSFIVFTLEPPWLNNEEKISCIPAGEYFCQKVLDKQFEHLYLPVTYNLIDVPKRSGIYFHPLNYISQTEGCLGIGLGVNLFGSGTLSDSKAAFESFIRYINGEEIFTLKIICDFFS